LKFKFPQNMASAGELGWNPSLAQISPLIHYPPFPGEAPANEIRVSATQSLSAIIERALEAFKTNDTIVVRGLGGAISGAVQVISKCDACTD
jgi:hypothetical protein